MYLLSSSGPLILMKFNPVSFATALASKVLPQPGGPYSSSPLRSRSGTFRKRGSYRVGHSSVSFSSAFTSSRPPMSAQLVLLFCSGTPFRASGVKPSCAARRSCADLQAPTSEISRMVMTASRTHTLS
jgi:hypothetical protein